MRFVLVSWHDAISDDDWTDIEKARELELPVIKTAGYLIFEDEKKIIVAPTYDEVNEKVASFYAIPKTWLIDIKDLDK